MPALYELKESQIEDMSCGSQVKDWRVPGNERNPPNACQAQDTLWIV
jgi:hypothetical protein